MTITSTIIIIIYYSRILKTLSRTWTCDFIGGLQRTGRSTVMFGSQRNSRGSCSPIWEQCQFVSVTGCSQRGSLTSIEMFRLLKKDINSVLWLLSVQNIFTNSLQRTHTHTHLNNRCNTQRQLVLSHFTFWQPLLLFDSQYCFSLQLCKYQKKGWFPQNIEMISQMWRSACLVPLSMQQFGVCNSY